MDRRSFLAAGLASTVGLAGCLQGGIGGDSGPNCAEAEVVDATVVPAEPDTATSGTGGTDTTTPAPAATDDYVVVAVRNDTDSVVTVTGYVESTDGRAEFSRDVPAESGKTELRFGPFAHHGIDEYEFGIEGC
ncbi:hypothetical protein [Haloarchaeobius sp. HME9146]|uniref:hypothetical protein n=1 Tax=unclassified Haloarchaeobius TaxID=2614452 RepID=UPI0021BFFC36|nr:hypothetical protein [Haloarchaeobius sp. HME9146]MCT9096089.1 hypothetical protein [Haloarchaeobius sp. HME9146]